MIFAVLLPLFAAVLIFAFSFSKKSVNAWQIGSATLLLTFLNIVSMGVSSLYQDTVYVGVILPFFTFENVAYKWQIYLDNKDIFLIIFMTFSALMSIVFAKHYIPKDKMNKFVMFLLCLLSSLILTVGAKNSFQFFAGWDLTALFSYLLLMLFYEKQAVRASGVNFLIWHTLTDIPLFCAFFMLYSKTGSFLLPAFEHIDFNQIQTVIFAVLVLLGVSSKLFLFGTNILMTQTASISLPALAFTAPVALGGIGVYTLFLFYPLVENETIVQNIYVVWGGLTAVFGGLIALAQTNIKVILCQILMSLFGFVLCAFGFANQTIGFSAYIALITPMTGLFFCAGTIILSIQGEEDILRMGDLRKKLSMTFYIMLCLCFCTLGFPFVGISVVKNEVFAVLQGNKVYLSWLSGYFFFLSFVFSRLLYKVFFATSKLSSHLKITMQEISKTMKFPLGIFLLLSLFQSWVFSVSILPALTAEITLSFVLFSSIGLLGLPVGLWYFKQRENCPISLQNRWRYVVLFCAKGFYLTTIYDKLFVRPFYMIAGFAWRISRLEFLTEQMPKLLEKYGHKLQASQSSKVSSFVFWTLTGLFLLLFSLLIFQVKGVE